jgi:hypothetical protein
MAFAILLDHDVELTLHAGNLSVDSYLSVLPESARRPRCPREELRSAEAELSPAKPFPATTGCRVCIGGLPFFLE